MMTAQADWEIWALVALAITGAPIVWRALIGVVRGRFAADLVASLAIVTAFVLRQPVAGLVIVLMQTGGEYLEHRAARRASRALQELQDASPRVAHRVSGSGTADVEVDDVRVDDLLLVRPGELIPVDGLVVDGTSWVDASRLTGESIPQEISPQSSVMSGSCNGDRPITIRATARAAESQYARIVELVRSAQASKAPLQRIADRYAVWFTPATLLVCGAAFGFTHDWTRVLAILMVATPCPLILATPVAMVGGISHAARHGIIVRHGTALESLSRVTVGVFDKTGTLTVGRPVVSRVVPSEGWDRENIVRLAAALEHGSGHLLARSIVDEGARLGGELPSATDVQDAPGRGVSGRVGNHRVAVGGQSFAEEQAAAGADALRQFEQGDPGLRAFVIIDGVAAGAIDFADELRPGIDRTMARLRDLGLGHLVLISGDHTPYVGAVARALGFTEFRGDVLPGDKVAEVARLSRSGARVLMVGDGVNDAPALSSADVGVALAAHGRGIASEAADVVLLRDDVSGVAEAIEIGRKTLRVARQSIIVGLGLSLAAMGFAAAGAITPLAGALIQEGIDVAVIINALRTSW